MVFHQAVGGNYRHSLRNHSEERSSQLLRGLRLKTRKMQSYSGVPPGGAVAIAGSVCWRVQPAAWRRHVSYRHHSGTVLARPANKCHQYHKNIRTQSYDPIQYWRLSRNASRQTRSSNRWTEHRAVKVYGGWRSHSIYSTWSWQVMFTGTSCIVAASTEAVAKRKLLQLLGS